MPEWEDFWQQKWESALLTLFSCEGFPVKGQESQKSGQLLWCHLSRSTLYKVRLRRAITLLSPTGAEGNCPWRCLMHYENLSLCRYLSIFLKNKQTNKTWSKFRFEAKKGTASPSHFFFFFFNLNPVQIYQITYFPPFLKKLISYAEPLCGICHLHSPEQRNKTSCREGTVLLNPS